MGIGRNALGTTTGKNALGVSTSTIVNVTLGAGSCLLVAVETLAAATASAVTWGATSLSVALSVGNLQVWKADNVSAGTHDIVIDSSISLPTAIVVSATEITGCTTSPLDKSTSATGSSTSPSSGATATTSQAAEILIGYVGTNGPSGDAAGTWSNSFNAGQRVGNTGGSATTNVTLAEGYLIVAATGTYTAAKTSITSRAWEAAILTFKEAAAGPQIATPPSLGCESHFGAVAMILGAVAVAAPSLTTHSIVHSPTMVTGAIHVIPAVVAMSLVAAQSVDENIGGVQVTKAPYDPTTVTSQNFLVIRASSPSALGDGDASTWLQTNLSPGTINPAGGICSQYAATMQDTGPNLIGDIAYVKFGAICWKTGDGPDAVNPRMMWTVGANTSGAAVTNDHGGIAGEVRRDDDGVDPGDPVDSSYYVHTGQITTQPNGQPWDTAAIDALVNVGVMFDYIAGTTFTDISAAEIFVEIYGAIGSQPEIINMRHQPGKPIRIKTRVRTL